MRVTEALKHRVVPPQSSSHGTDGDSKAGRWGGGPTGRRAGLQAQVQGRPPPSTPLVLRTAAGPRWGSARWGVTGALHLQTREGQDRGCPGAPPQQSVRSPSGEPTPRLGPSAAAGVPLWVGSGLPLGWSDPPGRGAGAALTWSPTHSRSQVLWASTHRLGLSWLGHTPGWLLGPGGRLAPEVGPSTRSSSSRSGLGASMGTARPGAGGRDHQALLRPCRASSLKASTFPGPWLLPGALPSPRGGSPGQKLGRDTPAPGAGLGRSLSSVEPVCMWRRPLPCRAPLWSAQGRGKRRGRGGAKAREHRRHWPEGHGGGAGQGRAHSGGRGA